MTEESYIASLQVLASRIRDFEECHDPSLVLAAEAVAEARQLMQQLAPSSSTRVEMTVETASVLARLHWYRGLALSEVGQDGSDELSAALNIFLQLLPVAPAEVPDVVRHRFQPKAAESELANDAAVDLMDHYEETGSLVSLATAETMLREAASVRGAERGLSLANLCLVLLRKFEATGDPAALSESVEVGRGAVALSGKWRVPALGNLGRALHARFELSRNEADLDESVDLKRQAIKISPADSPSYPELLANLASSLSERSEQNGSLGDLDEAVSYNEAALRKVADDYPDRAAIASNLGAELISRFNRTGQEIDLHRAIEVIREAVRSTNSGNPYRSIRLSNLAVALKDRFSLAGQRSDLEEAIVAAEEAVSATPDGHSQLPALESTLGSMLAERYDWSADPDDLDRAIDLEGRAVTGAPPGSQRREDFLSDLSGYLQVRFVRSGRAEDLDRAIEAAREAVSTETVHGATRADHLNNYALALRQKFKHSGQRVYLDEAITISEQAVSATSNRLDVRAQHSSNFGGLLLERFDYFGAAADLDAAIRACSNALDYRHLYAADLTECMSNLGIAYQDRSQLSGSDSDLDMSIDLFRRALEILSKDHPSRLALQLNLAGGLWRRYRRSRRLADLGSAITTIRDSLGNEGVNDPDRPSRLANLGVFLTDRYNVSGILADLDESISVIRAAIELTAVSRADYAKRLSNLGMALRIRFAVAKDAVDIDEAISVGIKAVEATPENRVDRAGMLSNLSFSLRLRYLQSGRESDLEQAIEVSRLAAEGLGDENDRVGALFNLGHALYARYQHGHIRADLQAAIDACRRAAATQTFPPRERIMAATSAGRMAAESGEPADGLADFAVAIELLPRAAWHGLDQVTQQEQLASWTGLAAEAAACAVAAGKLQRAVELLEQGRSVLWSNALHMRSDVSQLADRAPDLAVRLSAIRQQIDAAALPQDSPVAGQVKNFDPEQSRRDAYRALDGVIEDIRRVPGFEGFFKSTPFSELSGAVNDGPIVILNASTFGCHALVMDRPDYSAKPPAALEARVRVITLAVSYSEVVERANLLRALLGDDRRVGRSFAERERDRHAMFDLLEWLWETVGDPVIKMIKDSAHPADSTLDVSPRRLRWCPTGPWTLLPVHAAGRYSRTFTRPTQEEHTVPGLVVSSYTPTVTMLKHTQASMSLISHDTMARATTRQLAVGLSKVPGLPVLNSVPRELQILADYFPPPDKARQLVEEEATRANVLQSLPDYSWVHFACHGQQNAGDPSLSSLAVYDGLITIADISRLDTRQSELAFLSACSTASVSQDGLMDEAIHLAAAFQLLGYTHVIATMWSILDAPSPSVAKAVYDRLVSEHGTDTRQTAEALHEAVAELRQRVPDRPLVWAPYIHFGP